MRRTLPPDSHCRLKLPSERVEEPLWLAVLGRRQEAHLVEIGNGLLLQLWAPRPVLQDACVEDPGARIELGFRFLSQGGGQRVGLDCITLSPEEEQQP